MKKNLLFLSIGLNVILAATAFYFIIQNYNSQKNLDEFKLNTTYVVQRVGENLEAIVLVQKDIIAASEEEKTTMLNDYKDLKSILLNYTISLTDLIESLHELNYEEYMEINFQISEAMNSFEEATDDSSREAATKELENAIDKYNQFKKEVDDFRGELNKE